MLKVGITGGIGSGKTTVCRVFEQLNIPVFYADKEAKELYSSSDELKQSLISAFGPEVYTVNGVNKQLLATLVFANEEKLQLLNSLVHPLVTNAFNLWCLKHQNSPYVLKEAAILFESGTASQLDVIIGVTAPEELRIQRTMQRDHVDRVTVLDRMKRQMDQARLADLCQYLIVNDNIAPIIPQVLDVHSKLLALANQT